MPPWAPSAPTLQGRVALVAGATRGCGRAIAVALGQCGAKVYCTGRSMGGTSPSGRPETLEETARLVSEAGGQGVALQCDHTSPAQVEQLFQRISEDTLDVLVNDVWGGDSLISWGQHFEDSPLADVLTLMERAVHSHLITAHAALPRLRRSTRGLLVEVTDGAHMGWRGNVAYDLIKTSIIRLAYGLHRDAEGGLNVVCVTPGFLRSEAMLQLFGVTEDTWRNAIETEPDFVASETPALLGRGVAHLVADPKLGDKSGRVHTSGQLAAEYNFTDADGSRPNWEAYFASKYGNCSAMSDATYREWGNGAFDVCMASKKNSSSENVAA